MIIGIVAVAENYAIGKNGQLPWHYPADLKFFKQTTLNSAVVMGLHTWKSIGRPLPKRLNIVLSRSAEIKAQPNVLLLRGRDEVIALAKYLNCDLYLIGGAKTYENFADAVDRWIVTEVPAAATDADTFMPRDFLDDFELDETKRLEDGLQVKIYARQQAFVVKS